MIEYYRVSIFNEATSTWTLVGPTFAERAAAEAHMDTYVTPAKRIVTLNEQPSPSVPEAVDVETAGLDLRRLTFVRWLVETKRLNDDALGYEAEDVSVPDAVVV